MKEMTSLNIIERESMMATKRNPYFLKTIMRLQKKLYYGRKTEKNGLQSQADIRSGAPSF